VNTIDAILHGFAVALTLQNIGFVFVGALLGTIVGMLPGIGPAAGVSLLIPLTFSLEPVSALIMLGGLYYGAQYGGSITSILINTPGDGSAVMTTIDGYPLALAGRAGAALAAAAVASFGAGIVGAILLTVLATPIANFAILFGPPEYFMLMVFALTAVGSLVGESPARGAVAVFLGLLITTIGVDAQSGLLRYTFGIQSLFDGIPFVIVVVGLFAVGQAFSDVSRLFGGMLKPIRIQGSLWFSRDEFRRIVKPTIRGGIIGFLIGVLPGVGGTVAAVIAYTTEKRWSRTPERFGKGAIEGVAAPESANNAAVCGSLVPLLTLGVPGSGTTAVLLGAFIMYGIVPGPFLFQNQPDIAWGLINSMYLGNVMLLVLNLPLAPLFARMLYMPPGLLLAVIMFIASIGVYTLDFSIPQLMILLVLGVVGYLLNQFRIPLPPLILACVLGNMLETRLRQSMTLSDGDPTILLQSTICQVFAVLIVIVLIWPLVSRLLRRRRPLPAQVESEPQSPA
jgi:putative tricarboxylic transport membrane protein